MLLPSAVSLKAVYCVLRLQSTLDSSVTLAGSQACPHH